MMRLQQRQLALAVGDSDQAVEARERQTRRGPSCRCELEPYGDPEWEVEPERGRCGTCGREVHPGDVQRMQAIADEAVREHDREAAVLLRHLRGEHLPGGEAREKATVEKVDELIADGTLTEFDTES